MPASALSALWVISTSSAVLAFCVCAPERPPHFNECNNNEVHYMEDGYMDTEKSILWPGKRVLTVTLNKPATLADERDAKLDIKSCELETSLEKIMEIMTKQALCKRSNVIFINAMRFQHLVKQCHQLKAVNDNRRHRLSPTNQRALVWPGLKWCGKGSIAKDYHDLGKPREVDVCCRDHDYCDDIILSGETKHGLINKTPIIRFHCDCDEQFRKCLQQTKDKTADVVGNIYFNVAQNKCFTYDYPVIKCIKKRGFLGIKCEEYEKDTTKEKIWQWIDTMQY